MNTPLKITLLVVLAITSTLAFGPRVDSSINKKTATLPADLDAYLQTQEARFDDITPNTEKHIIWAGAKGAKTPLSIVYLHGYSATRQETTPFSENLAKDLGANLFLTRLSGHGRGGPAMMNGTVDNWANDALEAMAIGQRLGERVIVIGTSTGGTLSTWLALQEEAEKLAALIYISPNFALAAEGADMLTWPWGKQIAEAAFGKERGFEPKNEDHARYWTSRYPTAALLPMMALVKIVDQANLGAISVPVLAIYSEKDQVVSAKKTVETLQRFSSEVVESMIVNDSTDPGNHVIAGRIASPGTTPKINAAALAFINKNLLNKMAD